MVQTQTEEPKTTTSRERSYQWPDQTPVVAAAVAGWSGLELLTAMQDGRLPFPPMGFTIGMNGFEVGEGWARIRLTPQEFHLNPLGTVHGGVIATLLDTAAGCAVHTTLPPYTAYTSIDLTTKFLRPVTPATGHVVAEGRVVNRGSRTALAEARLTDSDGRLLAHATSTCMILTEPTGAP